MGLMIAYRLTLATVVSLCLLAGGLLLSVPTALAAAPPVIGEESTVDVGSSSATLLAQVNPEGTETTYSFEYGTSATYSASIPVPDGDAGAGTSVVEVQAHPQHLLAGTVYHFRVVATNSAHETAYGIDQTFTTQALARGPVLPDGRAWELVSPAESFGAEVQIYPTAVTQASEDGDAISYEMSAPFVANPAGNLDLAQGIARRGPGGWSSEDIATPHTGPTLTGNERYGEYEFFSPDLAYGLVTPFSETPLSPEVSEPTPYVRDDATGVYTPLLTAANVAPGAKFDDQLERPEGQARFVTASPDLSHVVLSSFSHLTTNANPESSRSLLYDWTAGKLQLVVPPETAAELGSGAETEIGGTGGDFSDDMRGAVPDNGLRVFWSHEGFQVYMTDMADGKATRLDVAQGVSEPSNNNSTFEFANSEGSLVFFEDKSQLTTSPGGGLYAYDVETGKLTLVTVAAHSGEEPGVLGRVLGAAEDGSDVYLVASGVLSEAPNARREKAVAGADNLYVMRREAEGSTEKWTASFIATLSPGDVPDWEDGEMDKQPVEVSPDGRYLAFMSDQSLTGYDNRDASSGEPDEEVYLYHSPENPGAEAGSLSCASCDPTGARPSGWLEPYGYAETPLSDIAGIWAERWVAATIPGMTVFVGGGQDYAAHEQTYLMDSGRLFFDSHDALVPQDINGVGDVYEYEPGGVGSCAAGNDGCVALISGGTGSQESAFADASTSGNDVFFVTTEQLLPQDVNGERNVNVERKLYDAHVCSTEAPCPSSVVAAPECTTADSCRAAPTPQPAIFGAPPSATFSGQGNATPTPTSPAPKKTTKKTIKCAKGKKLSHGKCVKKKSKKKRQRAEKTNRRAK